MKPIKQILSPDIKFLDIVKAIDVGGYGYVAIVDTEDRLLGMVTDGDVRRCLLNKTQAIGVLINDSPQTISSETSVDEAIATLKELHLKHMPVVDCNNILLRMIALGEDDFTSKDNVVVIMAGGLGTRLGELTKSTPKPMLKVGDRPIIQHIVEQFRDYGYRKFIMCTSYKKEVIEEYFQDGKKFGVNISYVNENKRLGTAGALSLLPEELSSPFFVINADVLSSVDYDDLLLAHNDSQAVATMCVRKYSHEIPYGVIECGENGEVLDIKEKPSCHFKINAGIYIVDPKAISIVPFNTFYDMPQFFLDIKESIGKVNSYTIGDYWIDIGQPLDYELAQKSLDVN